MKVPARPKAGITRYEPADAHDVAAFQQRTFGPGTRQVDRGRDAWLFDLNPCRTPGQGRDMWICRRDGDVVGQQAEIPFDLQVGDQVRRAAWGIDLMVDDAWRLKGVGPALVSTQLDHRPIVCGLNMSDQGFALYERGGFVDLGVIPVYLRPLDPARAVALASVPSWARRVAPTAGPALRAIDAAAVGALRAAGVRLDEVDRFDDRADDVWSAVVAAGDRVLARRDRAALGWSVDDRPDRDRLRRFYLTRRGRALGYVVLRPAGTEAAPTAVVVDYLAPDRWVAPMLVAAAAVARRQGAVALSVKTRNEPADRALRAAGFLRRTRGADDPIRFMVHCTDDSVAAAVGDPDRWFVTSADCDLEYAMTPAAAVGPAGPGAPGVAATDEAAP